MPVRGYDFISILKSETFSVLYFQKKRSAAYRVRRISAGGDYETIDGRVCSVVRFGRLQGNE